MDIYTVRRRTIKGQITRFETVVTNHAVIPITPVAVATYKVKADALAADLETVQQYISTNCPLADFDTHEAEYNALIARMENIVIFFNTLSIQAPTVPTSLPTADIKLPKLELPVFGGNYIDWFPFHDLFTATVHNNGSLSNAQKFQYLKTSLRGEAAMLIHAIPVTDGNYAEAWAILLNRFNNTREIVNAHIKRLLNQIPVRDESAISLRRLIDTTAECIRSLKVLQEPVQHWNAILIYVIGEKLDNESRRQWELSLKGTTSPTYEELTAFLEQRARALAASQSTSRETRSKPASNQFPRKNPVSHYGSIQDNACSICTESHPTFKCPSLLKATHEARWNLVKSHSLCFNCLKNDHVSNECKAGNCRKCKAKHNTLLHRESTSRANSSSEVIAHLSRQRIGPAQVILPTAIIQVSGGNGSIWSSRALIDSGSQASFISEQFMQKLKVKRTHQSMAIGGIGATGLSQSRGSATLSISSSIDTTFKATIEVLILKEVTERLPNFVVNIRNWPHINRLPLADPTFNIPGAVDILLGADVFLDLIQDGKLIGRLGVPGAFNTVFGWVVAGTTGSQEPNNIPSSIHIYHCQLEAQLARFWEIEELSDRSNFTSTEIQCEKTFEDTVSRNTTGRYIVRLPIKEDSEGLGESRSVALRRFKYVERRLEANPVTQEKYRRFMEEYIQLNHMELVPAEHRQADNAYYLPHHAVFKESSSTTKLRVVFDGSSKTSNGVSLNDILLVGPKLQSDLVNLLIRFRSHTVALMADIEKMYRQILINNEDLHYQRILWRRQREDHIEDYQLCTVTYGTASAPYLATKVLQQLSKDVESKYPLASQVLRDDFYMDDLLSGATTTTIAIKLQKQLNQATREAGFLLRKWASNDPAVLETIPSEQREILVPLNIDNAESILTLGLQWTPATDVLSFVLTSPSSRVAVTKRTILSDTARVFDPLGLLSPVIVRAKIILQEMWQIKVTWDEDLPLTLVQKWHVFREDLTVVEDLRVQRVISQPRSINSSLHGFCDASEKAYAAVVYLKTTNEFGLVSVQLIVAKTRIAPLKQITLPRLELCAIVLLARLITLVQQSLRSTISEVHGWSDSQIVLSWLASPPQRWKTFVANRVAEVQNVRPAIQWHHVAGKFNPADCASRGIDAIQLLTHPLWWHGPSWLQTDTVHTKESPIEDEPSIEERIGPVVAMHYKRDTSLLERYSSLTKLLHVTAYVQRYLRNRRRPPESRELGPLTKEENDYAFNHWIKVTQSFHFGEEIRQLENKKPISVKSKILSLTPYLDVNGILRVGGRLRHAKISIDQIHPVVLPRKSTLNDLIINTEHAKTLHGGPQLMMASLQSKFWIIGLRDAVRFHVRRCLRCVRQQAKTVTQLMGNLPASRVNPGRAFIRCGVDYAGPFSLKVMKGRGYRSFKGYIAIFACFSTRALHLELVSDMSTAAFLAAFKRFVARRGKCTDVHSDCGTNFVGANKELKEFIRIVSTNTNDQTIAKWMSDQGIIWHYNPPAAPHFGGLWEAGVKSVKYHLKRVIGETRLNFEEMQTLLCQVEACLNSRPLTPMTSDPSDLAVLTPGHFLIGDSLVSIPEPDLTSLKINRLSRWQLGQQILQHFWRRWQSEYLSRLQQRPKWTKTTRNIQVGDLVLLNEELPPTKWKMARIIKIHPGADQLVRVVTVKTADKELQRPVTKLCQLPLES